MKDGKSETLKYTSQRVSVNKILIVFVAQFDFHDKCNIQACTFFNVYVYANIYVFTPLKTDTLPW